MICIYTKGDMPFSPSMNSGMICIYTKGDMPFSCYLGLTLMLSVQRMILCMLGDGKTVADICHEYLWYHFPSHFSVTMAFSLTLR